MLLALAAVAQLAAALREAKQVQSSTVQAASKWDAVLCDQLCMQCPDGDNILIKRSKTKTGAVATAGFGAVTLGWGLVPMAQLAACPQIGFEFWSNRKKLPAEEQYFETTSWLKWFNVDTGLEKLKRQTQAMEGKSKWDEEAVKACEELADPFLWQRVKKTINIFNWTNETVTDRQEANMQKCLSHTSLCGADFKEGELQSSRWNPFASVEVCSPPPSDNVESPPLNDDVESPPPNDDVERSPGVLAEVEASVGGDGGVGEEDCDSDLQRGLKDLPGEAF